MNGEHEIPGSHTIWVLRSEIFSVDVPDSDFPQRREEKQAPAGNWVMNEGVFMRRPLLSSLAKSEVGLGAKSSISVRTRICDAVLVIAIGRELLPKSEVLHDIVVSDAAVHCARLRDAFPTSFHRHRRGVHYARV